MFLQRGRRCEATEGAYFNLAGEGSVSVLDHTLRVAAAGYLPVEGELIPTGPIASVTGTPFDLREEVLIGERVVDGAPGSVGPARGSTTTGSSTGTDSGGSPC